MLPRTPRPTGGTTRSSWLLSLVLVAVALGAPTSDGAAAAAPAGGLAIGLTGSPFSPDGDGINESLLVDVTSSVATTLTLEVRDFDGILKRTLASAAPLPAGSTRWTWNGRDSSDRLVADGPYRIVARATGGGVQATISRYAAKAPDVPYGIAPREIVVALNAGHGRPDPGAYYGGLRESMMNLDIARRLRAMLEASGVRVVMSRTGDRAVNVPAVDVSGDGEVTHDDELVARNDLANRARADVLVTLMNNAYGCHCAQGTETYTSDGRSWTPEGVDLARSVQKAHIARLRAFTTRVWKPTDRGVRFYDFSSVRPFNAKVMPRPALMPSILVESLFMDQKPELATLAQRPVRTALAVAYFEGITSFLATRDFGLRYEVLEARTAARAGDTTDVRVRLTNRGNVPSAGWTLQARVVPAVPYYYAKPARGTLIGTVPLPDGLAPGQSIDARLDDLPLPPVSGDWIVLLDVLLPTGRTLGDHGVVGAQWKVTLSDPGTGPSPSPTAARTQIAAPTPIAARTPIAAPPSDAPSPGPASESTVVAQGRPGGRVVPTPAPGAGAKRVERLRTWRRSLPPDALRDVPSVAGEVRWSPRAAFRRWVVPIDIPIESRAGMAGVHGDDHAH